MNHKLLVVATTVSLVLSAGAQALVPTGTLPTVDRFLRETSQRHVTTPAGLEGRTAKTTFDAQLGKPTFVWAKAGATPVAVGALASEKDILAASARQVLANEAAALGLTQKMIDEAEVQFASYNGNGGAVVRFRQRVNGHQVFHRYLNVMLDRQARPVAVSGYFATEGSAPSTTFSLDAPQAIAKAWANLGGVLDPASMVLKAVQGDYQWFKTAAFPAASTHVFEREPRSRMIYYPRAGGLEPAYYVELFFLSRRTQQLDSYAFVVSASSGEILHRKSLKADATAFTYRAFADATPPYQPFDSPLGNGNTPSPNLDVTGKITRVGVSSNLVTLVSGPIKTADPWLADNATTTIGNNVDACLDSVDPAGQLPVTLANVVPASQFLLYNCNADLGDYYPATTGDHAFDYEQAADTDPSTDKGKGAAVVNLFFINNWLHDYWYNHGFDEAAGNAQTSNFGRVVATGTDPGEGDAIKAQGQDGSGRNNANMQTPADGSAPTMQQYLFDGLVVGEVRQTLPIDSGKLQFAAAGFGSTSYDVTLEAALIDDTLGTSTSDGCGEAIPDPTGLGVLPTSTPGVPDPTVAGKIALIDRGSCNFTVKAQFAVLSGASALVVINNVAGAPISMGNADVPIAVPVIGSPTDALYMNLPSVMITKAAGDSIKAQIAAGKAVTLHLQREPSIDEDGTTDNQIVAHEFFHYVHHRLTDSSNQQSGAMSEGWGDTDAMLLSVRPDDVTAPGNDHFQGAYGLAGYVINNFWSGIRRAPYSTDKAVNAFTFKHISDGTATPDGGLGASNSEVHNAGEIWANGMWNCYAGLISRHPFAEAKERMSDYIIAGLKMTVADATYTEQRDAILAAAKARDPEDYIACGNGFSHICMGPAAVSPARDSTDLTGVTEDCKAYGTLTVPTTPTTPTTPGTPTTPIAQPPAAVVSSVSEGRFGGGAMNLLLLLPLLGLGLRRRKTTSSR